MYILFISCLGYLYSRRLVGAGGKNNWEVSTQHLIHIEFISLFSVDFPEFLLFTFSFD